MIFFILFFKNNNLFLTKNKAISAFKLDLLKLFESLFCKKISSLVSKIYKSKKAVLLPVKFVVSLIKLVLFFSLKKYLEACISKKKSKHLLNIIETFIDVRILCKLNVINCLILKNF